MKGFAKAFVVSGITLGAILGLNVTEHNGVSNEAKAQTAHSYWYKYNGYTASGGDFVLSNSFYQGLKAGNVTFNGIKVNQKYESKTIRHFNKLMEIKQTTYNLKLLPELLL